MGKCTEFGTAVFSSGPAAVVTKAKFKLTDDIKATVEHRSPQAVAVTLAGKKWEVAHDFGRKDTRLKYKTKVGGGSLTVKQLVPDGKWALVPNPVVELSCSGGLGKDSKLECGWDFMDRAGFLEERVYAGDDKQHKAWAKVSTKKGAAVGLRSKLEAGKLLHSAAATYSTTGGCTVSVKSKFSDGLKMKTTYEQKADVLRVAAKHSAEPLDGGDGKATLTLGMSIPLRKPEDPKIMMGIKWDL